MHSSNLPHTPNSTGRMRKPPLRARPYLQEEAIPMRKGTGEPSRRRSAPTASTLSVHRPLDEGSISFSSTPYDPTMSTYYSTPDVHRPFNGSVRNASALEDASLPLDLLHENSVRTSSMSELYPVHEKSDHYDKVAGLHSTFRRSGAFEDQQGATGQQAHSCYSASGTTFVPCSVDHRPSATQSQIAASRIQDGSMMNTGVSEQQASKSFTRPALKTSSRVDDSVALSDSVRAMMMGLSEVGQHESLREHNISAIKASIVYNAQEQPRSAEDVAPNLDDMPASEKPNIDSTSLHSNAGNAADPVKGVKVGSSSNTSIVEVLHSDSPITPALGNNSIAPSASTHSVTFDSTAVRRSDDSTVSSHRRASTLIRPIGEYHTELRMSMTYPEYRDLEATESTPSMVVSKRLNPNSLLQVNTERAGEGSMIINQSIANTYDYHDYTTTTDEPRSEPGLSDFGATRSNLIQVKAYANLGKSSSDNLGPGSNQLRSQLRHASALNEADEVQLGMSEVVAPVDNTQLGSRDELCSASDTTLHAYQLDANTGDQQKAKDVLSTDSRVYTRSTDKVTSRSAEQSNDGVPKGDNSGERLPTVPPTLDGIGAMSPVLLLQFQQFQLFQQFQQIMQAQQFQMPQQVSPVQYFDSAAMAAAGHMLPPFGTAGSYFYSAPLRPREAEALRTPIANARGPLRPSSASPYPGIESRVGTVPAFDKGGTQHIMQQDLGITESAIDIVNDVVNALDEHMVHAGVPDAQLDLHASSLITNFPSPKAAANTNTNKDEVEPSESFVTEKLRDISKLAEYRSASQGRYVLQPTLPSNISKTNVFKYMSPSQRSHFTDPRTPELAPKQEPVEQEPPKKPTISIKTFDDSCAFMEYIEGQLSQLPHMSHQETLSLLKQTMLGAVQQHKLLEAYENEVVLSLRKSRDGVMYQSVAGKPVDDSEELQILRGHLQKALNRNATLTAKLEEYADRIKVYKKQEMRRASAGDAMAMVEDDKNKFAKPPQGGRLYHKASPVPNH